MVAKRIIFSGMVQGVGFRFTANNIARRHQLDGYVRNLPDGTVEMLAQGPQKDIESCLTDIKESFGSYIKNMQITDEPPDTSITEFKITF